MKSQFLSKVAIQKICPMKGSLVKEMETTMVAHNILVLLRNLYNVAKHIVQHCMCFECFGPSEKFFQHSSEKSISRTT